MQGSNDGELPYPNYVSTYIGCKAKRQRVQWDVGALHLSGYGLGTANFMCTQLPPSTEENTENIHKKSGRCSSLALRYSITSGARNYCHLGRKV